MFCINKKLLFIIVLIIFSLLSVFIIARNNFSYKTSAANRNSPLLPIQGGGNTDRGEYPYMVLLYDKFKLKNNQSHNLQNPVGFCGGVLISSQWVLTAAHCLVDYYKGELIPKINASDIGIAIGIVNLKTDYDDVNVINKYFLTAKKTIIHDDYIKLKSIHKENDIALIKLTSSVYQVIKPVQIASFSKKPKWTDLFLNGTILGWGLTSENSYLLSERLQEAVLTKVRFNGFTKSYLESWSSDNPGVIALPGDSGGPLLYSQGGINKLLGIIQGGDSTVSRFVYVPDKANWINKTIAAQ